MADFQRVLRRIFSVDVPWQDWLFVPVSVQWVIVNLVFYPAYPAFIIAIGSFQERAGPIFPFTWASSFILFLYGIWLFAGRYRVDYIRTSFYAIGLSLAATSLFEILYQNVGRSTGVGNAGLEGQLINLSSIALALSSLRFWRASRPLLVVVILFLIGWLLWLATGYPQITSSSPTLAIHAYLFNAALKVGAFVMIGLLVSFAIPRVAPTLDKSHTKSRRNRV